MFTSQCIIEEIQVGVIQFFDSILTSELRSSISKTTVSSSTDNYLSIRLVLSERSFSSPALYLDIREIGAAIGLGEDNERSAGAVGARVASDESSWRRHGDAYKGRAALLKRAVDAADAEHALRAGGRVAGVAARKGGDDEVEGVVGCALRGGSSDGCKGKGEDGLSAHVCGWSLGNEEETALSCVRLICARWFTAE